MPEQSRVDVAALLLARAEEARVGRERVVLLVDGRSGSGKTTLARRLVAAWPVERLGPVQLVHLDDVYPGWHGLEAASRVVESSVLASTDPGWTTWDWERGVPGERRTLDPAVSLVVEGAGALTRASSAVSTLAVWLELDDDTRRARALGRDGATYEPWWEVWAAQEVRHLAVERPRERADVVVDVATGAVSGEGAAG
ncbi:ATP-binding protein [Frigoribacterium faeni]|uniref:ATP-binding protein n=1 Tax=Frigoribacterium faeni TaxID=145483 RepID=UPI001FB8A2B9|nr:ATP-binding protein [Frigoribacterium faeni]NIJ06096.1 uridine kinase [Frigoribacterium faeni]